MKSTEGFSLVGLALVMLFACVPGMWLEAHAQNGSLLHAPLPRSVMLSRSPAQGQVLHPAPGDNTLGNHAIGNGANSRLLPPPPTLTPPMMPSTQRGPHASHAMGYHDRPPVSIQGVSWTYQPAPPVRTFRKHDIVTIRVDEITRMMAEGSSESRKRTVYQAALADWIRLTDFRLRPDPQANGDPTVGTLSNNNYRAESTIESRESMTFNIAATVVDIRPNGSLVLEATKTIRVNDNLWETSLTGICRASDIAPDNVVLSKDLIDLEIRKADRGHLRDGYKRGWFQRWFDRVQPF